MKATTNNMWLVAVILSMFYSQVMCEIACTQYSASLNVSEAESVNSLIFNPKCTDTQGGNLVFDFTGHSKNTKVTKKKFKVGTSNGIVRIKKQLNADYLRKFRIYMKVTSTSPNTAVEEIQVAIFVTNVNDWTPKIIGLPTNLNIKESDAIGKKITTCTTKDKDYGENNVQLTIRDPTSIESNKWYIDTHTCDLYINGLLDFETKKQYTIIIVATDSGVPPSSTSQSVTINISDENDNYPTCPDYYSVKSIPENYAVGMQIDKVVCTDADSGANGQVEYAMSANNNAEAVDKFTVDIATGSVTLTKAVDYESLNTFEVSVDVHDRGVPSLTSTVIYRIVISDVDDNIPTWPTDPIFKSVSETTPIGTIVLTVTANDIDKPNTVASSVKYEMQTPGNPDWFNVDRETGSVSVKALMDVLTAPWVTMEILAYSTDKLNGFNVVTINITLTDENSVAPIFDQIFYQGNISENSTPDTYILTVGATDPEVGSNGNVEYYINSSIFKVDHVTGEIALNSAVNFEIERLHSIMIEARDKGTPKLSGFAFLVINVLPVNEFDPVIDGPVSAINIPENTEPGTVLININATDNDDGRDGIITFFIQNDIHPFTIAPDTGVLQVGSPLDREAQSQWNIVVVASDGSEISPRNTSITVTINLVDVNDNNPICDPLSNTVVTLPHQINKPLATISCSDADEGTNSEFTYTKISGDDKNAFSVHPATGIITLVKEPTAIEYTLSIQIKDKGDPQLSVQIAYNIIAELQFNISNLPITLNISESTSPSTELYDIDACCMVGFVRYEILSGNDDRHVMLDPASGKLILRKMFDYETKLTYRYNIRATSIDTSTITENYIDIIIEDSNDNSPKFDNNFQYINVSEDLPISTPIIKLAATDKDNGRNGEIVYSVSGGSNFKVDSSGNLNLLSGLDAETISQYTLHITATDKGNVPLWGTTTVIINVKNVNEFTPQVVDIQNGMILTNISEDATLGAPIISVKAEDNDINTAFAYFITQGNDDHVFNIDAGSGDIYLANILDRETTDQYNITVEVETSNGEKVSALVVIDVLDVNDNDPKFAQDVYHLDVTHDDLPNKVITTFIITDDDIGVNKDIFSLTITDGDPSNHFKIVGNAIQTNIQMNYYDRKVYSLTLKATDSGFMTRSGFTRVIITVLPKYKQPRFLSTYYTAAILEDVTPIDTVFDMDATADGGTEGNIGNIEYSIRSGNSDNDFVISDTTGIIHITSQIDFERKEEYILIIEAKSREDALLIASASVTLNVKNINDNTPVCGESLYKFNIDEGVSSGANVGMVIATDLDKYPYGTVSFTLGAAYGSADFSIDSNGVITTSKSLDYENQNVYTIPVTVDDGALTSGALVVISVNDVNDNTPTFTPGTISVDVVESMDIGQSFYTVRAEDLDAGTNGEIRYILESGNNNNQLGLDVDSGALKVASRLDRESYSRFNLIIRAEDKAMGSPKFGTLNLIVNVVDVNDNNPTFPKSLEDATINRSDPPGSFLLSVKASDVDEGDNADIVYAITNGNTDGLFLVDIKSGQIKTAASVGAADNEYNLVITAKDKGIPHRSGTMIVKIQVIPIKLTGLSDQSMHVNEEQPPGQELDHVVSNHAATPAIRYAINGGNYKASFQIDPTTGLISTLRKLDREKYPSYILSVDITDDGAVSYTKTVSVDVIDINDNIPVITTTDTNINVVENTPAGHIVAYLSVSDADSGDNKLTDLVISSTPIAAKVYFETDGNLLKIKKPLDYETTTSLTFEILAVDRGSPPRTGSIEVTISVINVDDGIEYTEEGEAPSIYISRETSPTIDNGEWVTSLTSMDFGIKSSTVPVIFTTRNQEGVFSVDSAGIVTVQKKELLKPEEAYFVWVVVTADNGGVKKTILGLLRIDTFNPNKHLVSLESSSDVSSLESHRAEFEANLKTFFSPTDLPKIWKIQKKEDNGARRKLLASISETLIYVIEGPVSSDIADIEVQKVFKDQNSILTALRMNPSQDGPKPSLPTPNYLIVAVNGHSEPISADSKQSEEETFITSMNGYITFALLGIMFLILIIILVIFFIYKKKKRENERMNDSSEELMPPEPMKVQRKIAITKVTGTGINKTPRKAPFAPADKTMTALDRKRSNNVSPVQSETSASDIKIVPVDISPRKNKSNVLEKRVLPIPITNIGKKVNTIDPNNGKADANAAGERKPVFTKRNNGPVVHKGNEYDGVAFDKEKQQRYAYNTKTGNTLWMEKNSGLGTGENAKGPNSKTKANPKLTVVNEAAGSTTPNLSTNLSIGMVSSDK